MCLWQTFYIRGVYFDKKFSSVYKHTRALIFHGNVSGFSPSELGVFCCVGLVNFYPLYLPNSFSHTHIGNFYQIFTWFLPNFYPIFTHFMLWHFRFEIFAYFICDFLSIGCRARTVYTDAPTTVTRTCIKADGGPWEERVRDRLLVRTSAHVWIIRDVVLFRVGVVRCPARRHCVCARPCSAICKLFRGQWQS